MDAAFRPAVVIDNGTGYTKVGLAGNVEPSFSIPTVVAVNESFLNQSDGRNIGNYLAQYNAGIMADLDYFIGEEALSLPTSGVYNLSYPIQRSKVTNWDTMEKFWQQCIYNYLNCDPEDHYFLLTESPITSPEDREYMGEIMFETFNVPGLYIAVQPILALSAGCSTDKPQMTGVVVDIGDGATHVVPVVDGYIIGSSIKSFPISGNDVTQIVLQLLQERGELIPPEDSLGIARKVKEMYCYTSSDIVKEYSKHDKKPDKYIKKWAGVKPKTRVPFSFDVGYERFLGPEVFFHPEIYISDYDTPLSEVIDNCVQSAPIDTRRGLYKNVVLRHQGQPQPLPGSLPRISLSLPAFCNPHGGEWRFPRDGIIPGCPPIPGLVSRFASISLVVSPNLLRFSPIRGLLFLRRRLFDMRRARSKQEASSSDKERSVS